MTDQPQPVQNPVPQTPSPAPTTPPTPQPSPAPAYEPAKGKIIIQPPKKKFSESVGDWIKATLKKLFFFTLNTAAAIIVLVYLFNVFMQKTQPVTSSVGSSFNDLKYKAYLVLHPDTAPSHGTSDGKGLPGFPLIDQIIEVQPSQTVYENNTHQIILNRFEPSPDGQFDSEKYYALLEKKAKSPDFWTMVTGFLDKDKVVYAHQVLHFGSTYWFIYEIKADGMTIGRFVDEAEALQFPMVWEVKET